MLVHHISSGRSRMDDNTRKTAMRMFTYGLYVVTSRSENDRGAFLANWLTQCSFEPAMLVVAVEQDAHSLQVLRASKRFVVNVLESGQRELAGWFGRHSVKVGDKLVNRELLNTPSGQVVLPEALAWVECQLMAEAPAGDHVLVTAEVVDAGLIREGLSLQLKETGFKYAG
jgi:flavin reductase (DIM6/NTAB) family NADH-FMN oxidoreductase RutF